MSPHLPFNVSNLLNHTGPSVAERWDHISQSGLVITFPVSNWVAISGLLVLLYRTVAVRLFTPYTMALFWFLDEGLRGWQADQLRVAMVNTSGPLDTLISTPVWRSMFEGLTDSNVRRLKERGIAWVWWVGALFFALFPFGVPFIASKVIPTVPGRPGWGDSCVSNIQFQSDKLAMRYHASLALDMLRQADVSNAYNYSGTSAALVGLTAKKDRVMVSADCPDWAPVCDKTNPLRVDVDYWLKPSDLSIAVEREGKDIEFGVLNTCYKVEQHTKLAPPDINTLGAVYWLMYGGNDIAGLPSVTDLYTDAELYGAGYYLIPAYNIRDPTVRSWRPNNTLSHNGDRTLLVYHIGAVGSEGPSNDPVFATLDHTNLNANDSSNYYWPVNTAVPIMCNTTFSVCRSNRQSCDNLNGTLALNAYTNRITDNTISKGFLELLGDEMAFPLLYEMARPSDAVLAGHSVTYGFVQAAPGLISGHSEIVRLVLAGRTRLTTAAIRAVDGFAKYILPGAEVMSSESPALHSMCSATLVPDNTRMSTTFFPPLGFLIFGLLAILLTFSGPVWERLFWKQLCVFTIRWRLRMVGQLHRETVEKTGGWRGGLEAWPSGVGNVEGVGRLKEGGWGYGRDVLLGYVPRDTTQEVRGEVEKRFARSNSEIESSSLLLPADEKGDRHPSPHKEV
ncbi:MAG: hypothetical protein M1839_003273 [Geoglossum umbratile]|nr:MAG: hypothetical protein M1839_003273 [Geoglossum umbratile]